ncbi:MAG: TlpA family protein disulfide reductase [Bacteroidetes bacterium]|nr:TlpA family protein disulfide reductase [Bacteroidota bacterium]
MRLVVLFCLIFIGQISFSQRLNSIKGGIWKGELAMNDRLFIPFSIYFSVQNEKVQMEIVNADERLKMTLKSDKDSVTAFFPESEAYLKFKLAQNNTEILGYWVNPNKKSVMKIPFNAWQVNEIIELAPNTSNITGRWKTTFSPNSKEPENAVGLFEQTAGTIKGTFLTETGDYRYLAGTIGTNQFQMSTFNGSWAFRFEGKVVGDSIYGIFYSGKSYQTTWIGVRDQEAKLTDEKNLTYVVNDKPIQFDKIVDLKGKPFRYPNSKLENKVIVFQIMGTWCPNCVDETKMLNSFYEQYQSKGLEIISLGYEVGTNQKEQINRLKAFKKRLVVKYGVLLAGTNDKNVAAAQFLMLNGIMSFPTSIIVDRKGKIRYIHTGFSGPATGEEHLKLRTKFESEIVELLNEK